jgi:site-specific DNA-cytosine methylase
MNVLSLFDGKSSGYTACEIAGISVENYYSSEINAYAIQVSDVIHPDQIRLGDVTKWREWNIDWSSIDLIMSGFPCQAWSVCGQQEGDRDERGKMFWVMLDIIKHAMSFNPEVGFLMENVKMKPEFEKYITHHAEQSLGTVHKIMIDSALVSPQNRKRYYWTSKPVKQPEDRNIKLVDVLEEVIELPKGVVYKEKSKCLRVGGTGSRLGDKHEWDSPYKILNPRHHHIEDFETLNKRRYSALEAFRIQTCPEHYIEKILNSGISKTQLIKIAGNGWTDEVIAHILKSMYAD